MEIDKKCGCKGIRTCLICEEKGNLTRNDENDIKETVQYRFCSCCGLCWPELEVESGPPLYLGHLAVVPEFVSSQEEEELAAAIDSIEWMPSQSGRRKQDFGPKVNFKKKKSKIGNFKGFPIFTQRLVERLKQCDDLSDFRPVELCHLDYDPDRGSAIEPHIDDTWIWGERLVTLNLVSSTVLTLTPANDIGPCDCQTQCLKLLASTTTENGQGLNGNGLENCKPQIPLSSSAQCLNMPTVTESRDNDEPLFTSSKLVLNHAKECKSTSNYDESKITENGYGNQDLPSCQTICAITNKLSINNHSLHSAFDKISLNNKISNSIEDKELNLSQTTHFNPGQFSNCTHRTILIENIPIQDMCTALRIGKKRPNIEVLVPLPARSLVVLAGCGRYNWFHEIKRKYVPERRLAMTFRELALDFMPGGSEENIGSQLLELGQTFYEISTEDFS